MQILMIFGQVVHCKISFTSYHFWSFLMTLLSLSSYNFCLQAVTLAMAGSLYSVSQTSAWSEKRDWYYMDVVWVCQFMCHLCSRTHFYRSSFPVLKLRRTKCRKVFVDYGRHKEKPVPRLVVINWSAWFYVTSFFNYFLCLYLNRFELFAMFSPAVIDWLLGVSTSLFFWNYFVFSFAR